MATAMKKVWQSKAQSQLQQWLKDGTAVKTELSMDPKVLKPDPDRLQSRVETDPEHIRALAEVLERGEELRPVVVFQEPPVGNYLLADGFHRHGAYKKHRRDSIPAYVVQGTLEDAVKFSASANLEFSKAPTAADKKKAVRMVLSTGSGFSMSNRQLGYTCGVSPELAGKVRALFCAENGLPVPKIVNGHKDHDPLEPLSFTRRRGGKEYPGFRKIIKGRHVFLGTDYDEAKRRLAETRNSIPGPVPAAVDPDPRPRLIRSGEISDRLQRRGVATRPVAELTGIAVDGLFICDHTLCVSLADHTTDAVLRAVGVVSLLRKFVEATISRAVICRAQVYYSPFSLWVEKVASQSPDPIEFVTLEELLAEFGSKGE